VSTPAFIERLRAGELTLMLGVRLADPRAIRLAHQSGHHAVLIDLFPRSVTVQKGRRVADHRREETGG